VVLRRVRRHAVGLIRSCNEEVTVKRNSIFHLPFLSSRAQLSPSFLSPRNSQSLSLSLSSILSAPATARAGTSPDRLLSKPRT
ncbi:unnamed protein product, partial [Prunus brigantina]